MDNFSCPIDWNKEHGQVQEMLSALNSAKGRLVPVSSKLFSMDFNYCKFPISSFYKASSSLPRTILLHNNNVVMRGYNKFYEYNNELNTTPPYNLVIKENGCLILVSAPENHKILISSKNSLHSPHVEVANKWIEKHLSESNQTRATFASFLYKNNITAAFELIDESFEQHIVQYAPEQSGLWLHGLIFNSVDFCMIPCSNNALVAEKFGFKSAPVYSFESKENALEFIKNDREIEGYVMHCSDPNKPLLLKFKQKNYQKYRKWREITTKITETPRKNRKRILNRLKQQNKDEQTQEFINWVSKKYEENPEYFDNHEKQGVLKIRNDFLQTLPNQNIEKTLLIPVGAVGCGKSTLGHVLNNIYGISVVQNDEFTGKKSKTEQFTNAILEKFEQNNIVYADKNNHIFSTRKNLVDAIKSRYQNLKIVYINFVIEEKSKVINHLYDRIMQRGENHLTLTPQTSNLYSVVSLFVNQKEELTKDEEPAINLDIMQNDNTYKCLTALTHLEVIDPPVPNPTAIQKLQESFFNTKILNSTRPKKFKTKYFCIRIHEHPVIPLYIPPNFTKFDAPFHCTVHYFGKNTETEEFKILLGLVGKKFKIRYTAFGINRRVAAFKVEVENIFNCEFPHVTIAKLPEAQSFESIGLFEGKRPLCREIIEKTISDDALKANLLQNLESCKFLQMIKILKEPLELEGSLCMM